MENETDTIHAAPVESEHPVVVRIWSPLAAALFSLLLSYPTGLVLALRNWQLLGLRREAMRHFVGAIVLSVLFICLLLFLPKSTGRLFAIALSVITFSYLKAKLKSDTEEVKARNPNLIIEYRPWYTGCGWALLGMMVFVLLAVFLFGAAVMLDAPIKK